MCDAKLHDGLLGGNNPGQRCPPAVHGRRAGREWSVADTWGKLRDIGPCTPVRQPALHRGEEALGHGAVPPIRRSAHAPVRGQIPFVDGGMTLVPDFAHGG